MHSGKSSGTCGSLVRESVIFLAVVQLVAAASVRAQEFTVQSIGDTNNVAVMEATGSFDLQVVDGSPIGYEARRVVAQEFFRNHDDDYDFIVVFTGFEYLMPTVTVAGEVHSVVGFYTGVKNDVSGIGREFFNNTGLYGSDGRLQGMIDAGCLFSMPNSPYEPQFTDTMNKLSHEILHRWAAYVKFDKNGVVSDELLGSQDPSGQLRIHWSFLLDTRGSVMFGNHWVDNHDGTFTSLPGGKYYSQLDLYLMGLCAPQDVPPLLLIESSGIDRDLFPQAYSTISGTPRTVTVDDIIAVEGARVPSYQDSQKVFKVAAVLLVRPGELDDDQVAMVRGIMDNWMWWFSALTDGRGQLITEVSTPQELAQNPGVEPPTYQPRTTPPSISEGVAWLTDDQDEDGSWSDSDATRDRDTAEAMLALVNFVGAADSVEAGRQWFSGYEFEGTDYLARAIMAREAAGDDATPLLQDLLALQNDDGGWGSGDGFLSNPLDTALALEALFRTGQDEDDASQRAVSYLLQEQAADGSWQALGEAGEIRTTSLVVMALSHYRQSDQAGQAVSAGALWLVDRQNPDGSFGEPAGTVYDTAGVLLALLDVDTNGDFRTAALDFLLNRQSEDGSWYESAHQTAVALRAIWYSSVEADLLVETSGIELTPPAISSVPADVRIDVIVQNRGLTDVAEAKVALYEGMVSPECEIAEQMVTLPGQSAVPVVFQATASEARTYRFYVVVDPDDVIPESAESNNTAIKLLHTESTFDFEIAADAVVASPSIVNLLDEVILVARVGNLGTADAFAVPVRFTLHTPVGSREIGTLSMDIPAGESVDATLAWRADTAGDNLTIEAAADPLNTFPENSESNNQATTSITIVPVDEPNLAVLQQDAQVSPDPAREGESSTLSVLVSNNGGASAEDIVVDFYDGVPGQGGVLLGRDTIDALAPGQAELATYEWNEIGGHGERTVVFVVDPSDAITEVSEEDNETFLTFDVLSLPDLAISRGTISFDPTVPREGDTVVVTVEVANLGEQDATGVHVEAREEDIIVGTGVLDVVEAAGSVNWSFVYDTAGKTGIHTIEVLVDPLNQIDELEKSNNSASRDLVVQNSDLWLSENYISPDGDGIQDDTHFTFRLDSPQDVQVMVENQDGEAVKYFAGEDFSGTIQGSVIWNGLDDFDRLVPDGTYLMQVRGEEHSLLAELPVVVDTNRSPLTEAMGTRYLLTNNLTSQLPVYSEHHWLANASGVLFHIGTPDPDAPECPTGLYVVDPEGEDVRRIVPWEWKSDRDLDYSYQYDEIVVSPSSPWIAFVLTRRNNNTNRFDLQQLWTMRDNGADLVKIAEFTMNSITLHDRIDRVEWSADGVHLSYRAKNDSTGKYETWLANRDATAVSSLVSQPYDSSYLSAWSPTGIHLVYSVKDPTTETRRLVSHDVGGAEREVFETGGNFYSLKWFDDRYLSIHGYDSSAGEEFLKVLDTIAQGESGDIFGALSADSIYTTQPSPYGTRIAVVYTRPGSTGLHLAVCGVEANCTPLEDESAGYQDVSDISWDPAGTLLSFHDYAYEMVDECTSNGYLVVLDADSGEVSSFLVERGWQLCTPDAQPPEPHYDHAEWMADGVYLLVEDSHGGYMVNTHDGTRYDISTVQQAGNFRLANNGNYITYETGDGTRDLWKVRSLLNLTAKLRTERYSAGIMLSGIAADKNFKGWSLHYSSDDSPNNWILLAPPGATPLVNEEFTSWIPPAVGNYNIMLTVEDLAGNVSSTTRRITWGRDASITNVYKVGDYFSPNGDGIKDEVEIHYTVMAPVHLVFRVHDGDGNLVRTVARDHLVAGPNQFSWDGRDDLGLIVGDGTYTITVRNLEFDFVVDNTPPVSGIEIGITANNLENSDPQRGPVDVVVAKLEAGADDENLDTWKIEYGEGENPDQWMEFSNGPAHYFHEGEDLEFVVGKKFRITATDMAGNRSAAVTEYLDELVIPRVVTNGDMDVFHLEDIDGPYAAPARFAIPGVHVVHGLETVREPLVSAGIQMWLDRQWIEASEVQAPVSGGLLLEWDNSLMDPGEVDAIRIKTVDVTGREMTSEPVVFGDLMDLHVAKGCGYNVEELSATQNEFEELIRLGLQVKSENDPRYLQWTDYLVFDVSHGDAIPAGSFFVPAPGGLQEGYSYKVRMQGIGASGAEYFSREVTIPVDCQDGEGVQILIGISYERANECNTLAPGRVHVGAGFGEGGPPPNMVVEGIDYYLEKSGEYELIRSFDDLQSGLAGTTLTTSQLPEGKYVIKVEMGYWIGNQHGVASDHGNLIVDRTLPEVSLEYPAGEGICGQLVPGDGCEWRAIEVQGSATDDNNAWYALLYGSQNTPDRWEPAIERTGCGKEDFALIKGSTPVLNTIGNWTPPSGSGGYLLRLVVTDEAGNTACAIKAFTMDANIEILASSDLRVFSPNGDGNMDAVGLRYTIEEPAEISVKAYVLDEEAGTRQLVRTIAENIQHGGGTTSVVWNGLDDFEAWVADGIYEIEASAEDGCGNSSKGIIRVEVDKTAPVATLSYPRAGDPVGMVVEVMGTAIDENFSGYELMNETSGAVISTGAQPVDNGVLGVWNTVDLEGVQTLVLVAHDAAGNSSRYEVSIDLGPRAGLITDLRVDPGYLSPNNDGTKDSTTVFYELSEQSDVTLEIRNEAFQVVWQTDAGSQAAGQHSLPWPGTVSAGNIAPDGRYTIYLLATAAADPAVTQTETLTVVVDNTFPVVSISRPESYQCLDASVEIKGTTADENLEQYSITISDQSGPRVVAAGTQERNDYTFAVVGDLPEGDYTLSAQVIDAAGNATSENRSFKVDRTPPEVFLASPGQAEVYGGQKDTVNVAGVVLDENATVYSLKFGPGDSPGEWMELSAGDVSADGEIAYAWGVGPGGTVADGTYTILLSGSDCVGTERQSTGRIEVDNTPPLLEVTTPGNGSYVTVPTEIHGTVSDLHLVRYTVEVSTGDCSSASRWWKIGESSTSVQNGILARLQLPPADGQACLRVLAIDVVGNNATALMDVTIDTNPPEPPELSGAIGAEHEVLLQWIPAGEEDVDGYRVYRDGTVITSSLVTVTMYEDRDLPEGVYSYTVRAVDRAGLESVDSNAVELQVDLTPPAVAINEPAPGRRVGGIVDIRGTAYSSDDFKEYRIFFGSGASPVTWNLIRKSPVPMTSALLSQWDTSQLADGEYSLKLEADDINGNRATALAGITVDNSPPEVPLLLSATPSGTNVDVTWEGVGDADLAGYLLYRNYQLANANDDVFGSLEDYLISGTSYHDNDLPDGTYEFYVEAMDQAGNVSGPSNTIDVVLDTRAPHALISEPEAGKRFSTAIDVFAEADDLDIAEVVFQYQLPGSGAWIDFGSPATTIPYYSLFDPVAMGLSYSEIMLRAVATDTGGRTDTDPEYITVTFTDTKPPASPGGLTAGVNGRDAMLHWTAVSDGDLAEYNVYRIKDSGSELIQTISAGSTEHLVTGLADGLHFFAVSAVDEYGNESAFSDVAGARIYAPEIAQPYTPTAENVLEIRGTGSEPGATVEVFSDAGAGPVAAGTCQADLEGAFVVEVELALGENVITASATDVDGNVSRMSDGVMIVYKLPPGTPTGLTATTDSLAVDLAWNPVEEPGIIGYQVFRDGSKLNADDETVGGTADASSSLCTIWGPFIMCLQPGAAIDGDAASYWQPDDQDGGESWWSVTWPGTILMTRVSVEWDDGSGSLFSGSYQLQAWSGAAWITLAEIAGNTEKEHTFDLSPAYPADALRLLVHQDSGGNDARLAEVRVWQLQVTADASYRDVVPANGAYDYQVVAVDELGFTSEPSPPLAVTVGDVVPPDPPTGLVATAEAADVQLSWSENSEADLDGYQVYRLDAAGWTRINTALLNQAYYIDAGLPNGVHTYRVTAVDSSGNESAPSDEAAAEVNTGVPAATVISSLTAEPSGGSLTVCWEPVTGATGYNLYRSASPGGPYLKINDEPVTETCFTDSGLVNGQTYYYRVTVIDDRGNESEPSPVASAVPLDTLPPERPVIVYPTTSYRPITVTSRYSTIRGLAEPGSLVVLYCNEAIRREEMARAGDDFSNIALPTGNLWAVLSPDEKLVAYSELGGVPGTGNIWLMDVDSGEAEVVVEQGMAPIWSPDGKRIAYTYFDATSMSVRIGIVDVSTGDAAPLTGDTTVSEDYPAWTRDGSSLVFTSTRYGSPDVWVKNMETGDLTQLTSGAQAECPQLFAGGAMLVFLEDNTLYLLDTETGDRTLIDDAVQADAGSCPHSPSPDDTKLAFVSTRSGQPELYARDISAGSDFQITSTVDSESAPAWAPDGKSLAFASEGTAQTKLVIAKLGGDSRLLEVTEPGQARNVAWLDNGDISYTSGNELRLVVPAGIFEFAEEQLSTGNNVFTVDATDLSGNTSVPAESITIVLDETQLPDLAVSDDAIIFQPPIPLEGQQADVGVTISNQGFVTARNAYVQVTTLNAAGIVEVVHEENIDEIQPGTEVFLSFSWDSAGNSGENIFFVVLDPQDQLVEVSEDNNYAFRRLHVSVDEGIEISLALDNSTYLNNEEMQIDAGIFNSAAAATGTLLVTVEDTDGYLADTVATEAVDLAYGSTLHFNYFWNTGDTYPGSYLVRAALIGESGDLLVENHLPFVVLAATHLEAEVVTDKVHYGPNDAVVATATIINSDNLHDASTVEVVSRITGSDGNSYFQATETIDNIPVGARVDLPETWQLTRQPPGEYSVQVEARKDSNTLATASTGFVVDPVLEFTGTVSAVPEVIYVGKTVSAEYSLTNSGNIPANGMLLRVVLLDPATSQVIDEAESTIDLESGQTGDGQMTFATAGLPLGEYQLSLWVVQGGIETKINEAGFSIRDGLGPQLVVISPEDGGEYFGKVDFQVTASDDSSGTALVQYRLDAGPWNAMVQVDVGDARYESFWMPGADEGGLHNVSFRAFDNEGNESETTTVAFSVEPCLPAEEVCDGEDNDCDGLVDEWLGYTTCGEGVCENTVANCVDGQVQVCEPLPNEAPEECDLLDNDCDGQTDEELGETACGLGLCWNVVANCVNGQVQVCEPLPNEAPEECDLLDNDCDGQTDEELGQTTCGLGVCEHVVENCVDGQLQTCDPQEGATEEICDGLDNDCNGIVDDRDVDGDGYYACADDCDDEDAAVNPASEEIPGNGKDDDCNPATPDQAGPGLPEFVQAVCVEEFLTIYNNAQVASFDPLSGELGDQAQVLSRGDLEMRNNSSVLGYVVVWGDLSMRNNSYITADALVGGTIELANNAWIGGDQILLGEEPPPCGGDYDVSQSLELAASYNDNDVLQGDPDIACYLEDDGGMVVDRNSTLTLPGGTYYLSYLEVENNAEVMVAEGAEVHLFVSGSISFRNNSSIHNGPEHPEHLVIVSGADSESGGEVIIRNNADLGLFLYAPYANIVLKNNAEIYGGIVCRRLDMKNNTQVLQLVIPMTLSVGR